MIPSTLKLVTKRLILRNPTIKDLPEIYSATRYKGFNDGMLWDRPKQFKELIEPFKAMIKSWENGDAYSFSLYHKLHGSFIGRASIRKEDSAPDVWNVGFWTHPEEQGKGYMTEAVQAIIDFGFNRLGASRIEACYAQWNQSSEKVLVKNGMKFLRNIQEGFLKNGQWVAENLFGIERSEWEIQNG